MARVPGVRVVEVSTTDLQRIHLHHLRYGPPGLAAGIETMAGLGEATVAEVVAGIDAATRSAEPELAGWASVVAPYVRAAIEAGALRL